MAEVGDSGVFGLWTRRYRNVFLPVAILLGQNIVDYSILIGSLLLVMIVELLNSGLEAVVDRVGDEHHKLAGRAKDMGSAAVFIALLNVIVIWSMYSYQYFMN